MSTVGEDYPGIRRQLFVHSRTELVSLMETDMCEEKGFETLRTLRGIQNYF